MSDQDKQGKRDKKKSRDATDWSFVNIMRKIFNYKDKSKGNFGWETRQTRHTPTSGAKLIKPDRRSNPASHDTEYDMTHKSRGRVFIFNHKTFKKGMSTREGTDKDVENLKATLPKLGYHEIEFFKDLRVSDIEEELERIAQMDHTDSDSLVIFVLTHGQSEGKIHAYDREYSVESLWDNFTADKCPTLIGKPKIFFIIACRGENMDDGARVFYEPQSMRKQSITEIDAVKVQPTISYRIPIMADFLTVYSTMEGYFSYRNPEEGTWYIQALCQEIKNFTEPKMHLLDFLTMVNRRVAVTFQTYTEDPKSSNKKQCPFITSSLTKIVCLQLQGESTLEESQAYSKGP